MAKIDFSTAIPTSYRFIASITTFDYFKKDKLFSRNDKPAFNQKDERFLTFSAVRRSSSVAALMAWFVTE